MFYGTEKRLPAVQLLNRTDAPLTNQTTSSCSSTTYAFKKKLDAEGGHTFIQTPSNHPLVRNICLSENLNRLALRFRVLPRIIFCECVLWGIALSLAMEANNSTADEQTFHANGNLAYLAGIAPHTVGVSGNYQCTAASNILRQVRLCLKQNPLTTLQCVVSHCYGGTK